MRTRAIPPHIGAESDGALDAAPGQQRKQDRSERAPAAARRSADAQFEHERARRRGRDTPSAVLTSSSDQADDRDADGLARSRYAADRSAATVRHPSGPPAPRR